MHPLRFALAAAAALLLTSSAAQAQSSPPPAPQATASSTQAGVYTVQQAVRGRTVYAEQCSACHSTATHSGAPFMNRWGGRPLAELYALIAETMPQIDPGSLTKEQYTDLVAYLLQINGMPAGQRELPADTSAFRRITIEPKK